MTRPAQHQAGHMYQLHTHGVHTSDPTTYASLNAAKEAARALYDTGTITRVYVQRGGRTVWALPPTK
jgi:hypothetical protein